MATGTKKVDPKAEEAKAKENEAHEYAGRTEGVNNVMKQLGELEWEERLAFSRRFTEVFNQEGDKRSQGLEFDTKGYN